MPEDVYYKKTIPFNAWKHNFQFKTSQELFSSHDVDAGTRQLLRTLVEADYPPFSSVLDLGCGYGPAGLVLKALYPTAEVHLVDRDALAVDYTRQNAELNGLNDVKIYPSLGYDDLPQREFDLIVSNIPGKAGEPVIDYLLREAVHYLAPDGLTAVVVVTPLEPLVSLTLARIEGVEVILKRDWAEHSVLHFRFHGPRPSPPALSALERGIYNRRNLNFHVGALTYPMDTAWGLPDFDSLGNENDLLFYYLDKRPPETPAGLLIANPGQGHSAVMLWRRLEPQRIWLADRDLLSLRYARHNLTLSRCPAERVCLLHQTGLDGLEAASLDLAVVALREEEGPAANLETLRRLEPALTARGRLIVTAGSTAITRLADNLKRHKLYLIQDRDRWRGQSLLALTRR